MTICPLYAFLLLIPASLLVEVTHTLKIIQNIMPIVGIVKVHQTFPLKGFKTLNIVQLYSSYRN